MQCTHSAGWLAADQSKSPIDLRPKSVIVNLIFGGFRALRLVRVILYALDEWIVKRRQALISALLQSVWECIRTHFAPRWWWGRIRSVSHVSFVNHLFDAWEKENTYMKNLPLSTVSCRTPHMLRQSQTSHSIDTHTAAASPARRSSVNHVSRAQPSLRT